MPRASAEDAARTARHVLEAATGLFATRGYANVSLDDVASSASVTRGAIYHHYRNKANLFTAVASLLQSSVAAAVLTAAEQADGDAADRLRAGSHAFLDAITAAPAARVLLVDAPAVIGWAKWRALDSENSVLHLREALADTGVPSDLLDATTTQLSGAMNEAALWLAQHPDDDQARDAAHRVLDRLLDAATS